MSFQRWILTFLGMLVVLIAGEIGKDHLIDRSILWAAAWILVTWDTIPSRDKR